MSFLEGLAGAEGEGVNIGRAQLSGLISQGISEGMSGASMLSALKDAGAGIRSQDFYGLVREVRSAQEMAGTWAEQAVDSIPDAEAFVSHTGSAYQGYEYRVPIFYRETGLDVHDVGHKVFTIRSQELLTPQDAIEQATSIWEEGRDTGTGEGQEMLGIGTVGLHVFGR